MCGSSWVVDWIRIPSPLAKSESSILEPIVRHRNRGFGEPPATPAPREETHATIDAGE